MLNKAKILKNYTLNCTDGEIGKVKEFYFEDQNWTIRYLIVNTGNWLTGREVLVSPLSVISVNKEEEYISINLSKSQIENSPLLESDKPVSEQFQREFYGYYAYPMYSEGMGYSGVGNALPLTPIETDRDKFLNKVDDENEWDPHLRSTRSVSGYGIQSSDEEIGHVDDFIINVHTWEIPYLEIDTKNWLPGKKVLISPNWIERISWDDSLVVVSLSSDEIKISPEYTTETLLDRDFESKLYKHYHQDAYWLK